MTSPQFKNLVDIGQIKQEPGDQKEFDGLLHSGRTRLKDSRMDAFRWRVASTWPTMLHMHCHSPLFAGMDIARKTAISFFNVCSKR